MHAQTVSCGIKSDGKKVIFTNTPKAGEHSPGAVAYEIGSGQITIRSTSGSWGSIPIEGPEAIAHLRDALCMICKMMKIPPTIY